MKNVKAVSQQEGTGMKTVKLERLYLIFLFILLGLLILTAINYTALPNPIPIHWSSSGPVNGFLEKGFFILTLLIMFVAIIGLYYFEKNGVAKKQSRADQISIVIALSFLIGSYGFILFRALIS